MVTVIPSNRDDDPVAGPDNRGADRGPVTARRRSLISAAQRRMISSAGRFTEGRARNVGSALYVLNSEKTATASFLRLLTRRLPG